jgi:hypothetical protein
LQNFFRENTLIFVLELREENFILLVKLFIGLTSRKGVSADHDCLENSQVPDLSQDVSLFWKVGQFFLIWFDAAHEMDSGGAELLHEIVNLF